MKTKQLFTILGLAGAIVIFSSCSETLTGIDETLANNAVDKSSQLNTAYGDSCTFDGVLSEAEIEGLLLMREEEKLARDVYLKLYEIHQHQVFSNIANSEDAHTNAVLNLINGYGLADPASSEVGEFNDTDFSELYSKLVSDGSVSLADALKTGAFVEEYDIADLWALLNTVENSDVKRVYENLLSGSESHLRAFTNALTQIGETYTPQIITAEEYALILSGSNGKGNGSGYGQRNNGNMNGQYSSQNLNGQGNQKRGNN